MELYLEVYLIECAHAKFLSIEGHEWCTECKAWVEGEEIGYATIHYSEGQFWVAGAHWGGE